MVLLQRITELRNIDQALRICDFQNLVDVIYSISAGKRDHIRKADIVGALCELIPFEDIGTIFIDDRYTDVQLLSDKTLPEKIKIKGKIRKIKLNDSLPF